MKRASISNRAGEDDTDGTVPNAGAPSMLRTLLEDPSIEKQKFGAASFLRGFVTKDSAFFSDCLPTHFLDLRSIARVVHPRLDGMDAHLVTSEFMVEYAKEGLGVSLDIPVTPKSNFAVQKLSRDTIDGKLTLVNEAWITHIAGSILRQRLESKITESLDKEVSTGTMKGRLINAGDKAKMTRIIMDGTLGKHRWSRQEVKDLMEINRID
ncbi:uncharacterized protein JCM15063_006516 [Sporobolomyces koalae]|uniref:uncharacterized protein n=1 Tax=Sporobolomyces koalae TaxID=500713 RepID=UPI0031732FE3